MLKHALGKAGADTGTAVLTGDGQIFGINFDAGESTDTLKIYDAASATGVPIFQATGSVHVKLPGVAFDTGIYRVQTGANSVSNIYSNRKA